MRKQLHSIQFLRFVAAAFVVLDHVLDNFGGPIAQIRLGFGTLGVHLFFVISGLIMVYSSFDNGGAKKLSPGKFLWRRATRIYPTYWLYTAAYIAFLGALVPSHLSATLALLPGYSSDIIGPGWTLGYEIYFYICFALALMFPGMFGVAVLTVWFFASISVRWLVDAHGRVVDVLFGSLLIDFLLGVAIGVAVTLKVRATAAQCSVLLTVGSTWVALIFISRPLRGQFSSGAFPALRLLHPLSPPR